MANKISFCILSDMRARTPGEIKSIEKFKKLNPDVIILDEVPDRRQSIYFQCKLGFKHLKGVYRLDVPLSIKTALDKTGYFKAILKELQPDLTILGEYFNSHTKIRVQDLEGFQYEVGPESLLQGYPPSIRTAICKNDHFAKEASNIHGGRYSYEKSVYKNMHTKVIITCPDHGDFLQRSNSHLQGQGCPECSAIPYYTNLENYEKACDLYILKFRSGDEVFFKIGVSAQITQRMSSYKNDAGKHYKITQTFLHTTTVKEAYHSLEQPILKLLRNSGKQYWPKHYFIGHSECFLEKDLRFVQELINNR